MLLRESRQANAATFNGVPYVQSFSDGTNVLDAAITRIAWVFDTFEKVIVSVSGGKDSTVLAHLALAEASRRGRRIGLYFLDEEVVYQSTIDQITYLMELSPANTIPLWLQVPFHLTNSTSLTEGQLRCWEPGEHKQWMRPKVDVAIKARPWDPATETVRDKTKGLGFYDVIENYERCHSDTAFLVGLRGVESPNRWRTMVKHPVAIQGKPVFWGTRKGSNTALYPLYDWTFADVWRYLHEFKVRYSKIYDMQFRKGYPPQEMRVSSLIHEGSFKSLVDLPEFEPKTYAKLLKRIKGIALAQETAKSAKLFACRKLPKNYTSWRTYRDFLLTTYPDPPKATIFCRRFANHQDNEYVARQQCRQLVLGDYENNVPVRSVEDPREALIRYYESVL